MAYLLDSNHASALLKPQFRDRLRLRLLQNRVLLCAPVVGELFYFASFSAQTEENFKRVRDLVGEFDSLTFGMEAAREWSRLRGELRRAGRPVPSVDLQIAVIALLKDLTLLTADHHFTHIPNLRVENWLA